MLRNNFVRGKLSDDVNGVWGLWRRQETGLHFLVKINKQLIEVTYSRIWNILKFDGILKLENKVRILHFQLQMMLTFFSSLQLSDF